MALVAVALIASACSPPPPRSDRVVTDGDAKRGPDALRRYGCGGCHVVPGVREARGRVGPPLAGLSGQAYIAGRLTNGPMNLVLWIRTPRAVDPATVMPDLGVTEADARDIAAYLYSVDTTARATGPEWPGVR